MEIRTISGIRPLQAYDYTDKTVLVRVDINSPIDPVTKRIVNDNRIRMSIPTLEYLLKQQAKVVIIAHQGDTLDYQNLIPMWEHAQKLTGFLGTRVSYLDDVAGLAAQEAIKALRSGEAILLGNLRYLCEEISTFEDAVKLSPIEMLNTYLVRNLAPWVDIYVNDAFAAAHRNCPSMVAFQEIKPTAAGILLLQEVEALTKVMGQPARPSVFVLGGAKISDAFGMMKPVLENGSADKILACGITGQIMLLAQGNPLGVTTEKFIKDKSLDVFISQAHHYLNDYPNKIVVPLDMAFERNNARAEIKVEGLPVDEMIMDIGPLTIAVFKDILATAGTIFANGPAGVYESPLFETGTREIWQAMAKSAAYTVIGGGDTINAAARFSKLTKFDYVCTAGGAMVRFLSGKQLPLIEAMKKASLNINL